MVIVLICLIPLVFAASTKRNDIRIAAAICLVLVGLWVSEISSTPATAIDFSAFYRAANVSADSLYQSDPPNAPFIRPAVFSVPLAPLAYFSYWKAFAIWEAVNCLAFLAALGLLWRFFSVSPYLLVASCAFISPMLGMISGQDVGLVLLAAVGGAVLLKQNRDLAAGILLGFCCYKFNLFIFVPAALLLHRKWRALAAFSIVAATAFLVSVMMVPLHTYVSYLSHVSEMSPDTPYAGIRGWLGSRSLMSFYFPIAAIGSALTFPAIIKMKNVYEAVGLAIGAAFLLAPHTVWYDGTLMLIPIAMMWETSGPYLRTSAVMAVSLSIMFYSHTYMALLPICVVTALFNSSFSHDETSNKSAPDLPAIPVRT